VIGEAQATKVAAAGEPTLEALDVFSRAALAMVG